MFSFALTRQATKTVTEYVTITIDGYTAPSATNSPLSPAEHGASATSLKANNNLATPTAAATTPAGSATATGSGSGSGQSGSGDEGYESGGDDDEDEVRML